uniref:Uncharacterized protein n=1 Tax=Rhinopithecus roxellana TaxID=61622 RepID=A0A2K6RW51_RHIRO
MVVLGMQTEERHRVEQRGLAPSLGGTQVVCKVVGMPSSTGFNTSSHFLFPAILQWRQGGSTNSLP